MLLCKALLPLPQVPTTFVISHNVYELIPISKRHPEIFGFDARREPGRLIETPLSPYLRSRTKARWGLELSVFMILEMLSPISDFFGGIIAHKRASSHRVRIGSSKEGFMRGIVQSLKVKVF